MRKFYFIILFTLITFNTVLSQGDLDLVSKITQSYFRSDPFKTEFSSFLSHLVNDPSITNKVLEKRTDSSLFFFQGTYTSHNPFFFKPTKVVIALTESIIKLDSLPQDTIYIYQLFAYDNDTKEGVEELKKEFDKLSRRYKKSFTTHELTENSTHGDIKGATYNFFDPFHAVSPFALSWVGPDENKEMCLVLTVRMDNRNNKAILPVPLYALK